jgi:AraC-like DNA-binding protein
MIIPPKSALSVFDSPLRLDFAGEYEAPKGKNFPLHKHPYWEMIYFRTGNIQCQIGNDFYDICPGTMLIIPPGFTHGDIALTAYSNFYLSIDDTMDRPWPRLCRDNAESTFGSLCERIVAEFACKLPEYEKMVYFLLGQLDIQLLRYSYRHRQHSAERVVYEAEQIVNQRFTTSLTIEAIAREIGVSPAYLRANFKRLRGVTLMSTLQTFRIQRALALISQTDLSLENIAQMSGYDSASHMSRYIKRSTGKSPGAFRNSGDFRVRTDL